MQQLLAPQVAWLQLHSQPSPSCPLGLELVTAADFQQRFGFPPAAYPDWLALVGKREASIGGAGVGGKAAAKLLARYGSLEAVLQAAEAGELKGWGPAAQRLLHGTGGSTGEERAAQLRRNRRLFAANTDPSVVNSRDMQQLPAALQRWQPVQQQAATDEQQQQEQRAWSGVLPPAERLAWLQPVHARRWRHLQQLAAEVQQQAGSSSGSRGPWQPRQAATPQALAVDELLEQPGGSSSTAVFYICPCDVAEGSWERANIVAQQAPVGSDATKALLPLLSGAMRHHVKLVQRAGYTAQLALPPPLLCGAVPFR
ncbi:DNA polymerase I [Chlorella sorokiniana]|uniref:DNA polymerase I n=1 Tax=Chlorella sorokiniana TaxID=3076 RepID=A0A2P6TSK7_CHLSO|nr:DNA polymerase I [Chlorella sorokiniana]|eukprot:PRW57033.1 DNA polymerase I [Chlorella sorokiniana]